MTADALRALQRRRFASSSQASKSSALTLPPHSEPPIIPAYLTAKPDLPAVRQDARTAHSVPLHGDAHTADGLPVHVSKITGETAARALIKGAYVAQAGQAARSGERVMIEKDPEFAEDLLCGADEIRKFLNLKTRRSVYHLAATTNLPVFRIGAKISARKSTLLKFFKDQEARRADVRKQASLSPRATQP